MILQTLQNLILMKNAWVYGILFCMLLPTTANFVSLFTEIDQVIEFIAFDQPEESKESKKNKKDAEDKKIDLKVTNKGTHLPSSLVKQLYNNQSYHSEIIIEIPIPPPEYC